MAWRIVKQPNGLLARFSEIADSFTDVSMTQGEALELCMESMSEDEAMDKVQRGIDSDSRWDEAIGIIERVHGVGVVEEIKSLIGLYYNKADTED